ncbi:hypothetical protein GJ744_012447 [Endocarpon pusillum]|uniref:Actin-like ATPase domain-containing protein n=1 Tax=Endocarpon pusillum TaxID=364733 RepID=A0A8H7AF29_9EURO|nr:hypothetical protein GJ744_012447 [Endocarpon pusillum]
MASNITSSIASSVRPSLRQAAQPPSPHTPSRFASSNLSSPGSGFRQEDDAVIIELGSRYLRAGFEGEHSPQCILTFGPEDSRRAGDYRGWAPGHRRKHFDIEEWGQQHELWRMDLRDVDLGLVEDKIERAFREVYNEYLLTDAGSARLMLVVPSILPHPLLSTVLTTLFNRWKYASITLLPSPTMAAMGAGVRSALGVDIGWSETTVTAVYEYRELRINRSTRSMRSLLKELARTVIAHRQGKGDDVPRIEFELAEELMARMVWCKHSGETTDGRANPLNGAEAQVDSTPSDNTDEREIEIEIDWPTGVSSQVVTLPLALFSQPVEKVFLASDTASNYLDDNEHSLPMLVYETLQALPPDARALCMSRITFVGGGSKIPGLAPRTMFEVDLLVKKYGWSTIRGKRVDDRRDKLREIAQGRAGKPDARFQEPLPPGEDYIEEKLRKQQAKEALPVVQGQLRRVESLGAWTGASLLASMKVKGFVDIEREKFLQHGLAGARNNVDISVIPQRTSSGAGFTKAGDERKSWTLAGWA